MTYFTECATPIYIYDNKIYRFIYNLCRMVHFWPFRHMLFFHEISDYDLSVILWANFRFPYLYSEEK